MPSPAECRGCGMCCVWVLERSGAFRRERCVQRKLPGNRRGSGLEAHPKLLRAELELPIADLILVVAEDEAAEDWGERWPLERAGAQLQGGNHPRQPRQLLTGGAEPAVRASGRKNLEKALDSAGCPLSVPGGCRC